MERWWELRDKKGEEEPMSERKKDGPGPVMVSSTLCPAVHILGSQNMYGRAEGIALGRLFLAFPWPTNLSFMRTIPLSSNGSV